MHPLKGKTIIMKYCGEDHEGYGETFTIYRYSNDRLTTYLDGINLSDSDYGLSFPHYSFEVESNLTTKAWIIKSLQKESVTDLYALLSSQEEVLGIPLIEVCLSDVGEIPAYQYNIPDNHTDLSLIKEHGMTLHLLDADDDFKTLSHYYD